MDYQELPWNAKSSAARPICRCLSIESSVVPLEQDSIGAIEALAAKCVCR